MTTYNVQGEPCGKQSTSGTCGATLVRVGVSAGRRQAWCAQCGTKRDIPAGFNHTEEPDVVRLSLCEQNKLVLKPGILYLFTVNEKCQACCEIAEKLVVH